MFLVLTSVTRWIWCKFTIFLFATWGHSISILLPSYSTFTFAVPFKRIFWLLPQSTLVYKEGAVPPAFFHFVSGLASFPAAAFLYGLGLPHAALRRKKETKNQTAALMHFTISCWFVGGRAGWDSLGSNNEELTEVASNIFKMSARLGDLGCLISLIWDSKAALAWWLPCFFNPMSFISYGESLSCCKNVGKDLGDSSLLIQAAALIVCRLRQCLIW